MYLGHVEVAICGPAPTTRFVCFQQVVMKEDKTVHSMCCPFSIMLRACVANGVTPRQSRCTGPTLISQWGELGVRRVADK